MTTITADKNKGRGAKTTGTPVHIRRKLQLYIIFVLTVELEVADIEQIFERKRP